MKKIGFISTIKRKIGNLSSGGGVIYNMMKPLTKLVPPGQAIHPMNMFGKIRYNYCGPLNDMDNGEPTNKVDSVCQKHDNFYDIALKENDKATQKRLFREADRTMLTDLSNTQTEGFSELLGKGMAYGAISSKIALEDFGSKIGSVFGY